MLQHTADACAHVLPLSSLEVVELAPRTCHRGLTGKVRDKVGHCVALV